MFIRRTLISVRRSCGDESAALEAAHAAATRLAYLARKIVDSEARASFLANVSLHRELVQIARAHGPSSPA
jgi:hypothetical protein